MAYIVETAGEALHHPSPDMTRTTQAFQIETLTADGWSDDASLLGFGASQEDNRWPSRAAALAACAELCAVLDPTRLRVAEI